MASAGGMRPIMTMPWFWFFNTANAYWIYSVLRCETSSRAPFLTILFAYSTNHLGYSSRPAPISEWAEYYECISALLPYFTFAFPGWEFCSALVYTFIRHALRENWSCPQISLETCYCSTKLLGVVIRRWKTCQFSINLTAKLAHFVLVYSITHEKR